jgi:uncharacterized OB-fold protein
VIELAICQNCGAAQYPFREVCVRCLSDNIDVRQVDAQGTLLACTRIHRSFDPRFSSRLPLQVGSVKLDAGPVAIAFVSQGVSKVGMRVRLDSHDEDGRLVLVATPIA